MFPNSHLQSKIYKKIIVKKGCKGYDRFEYSISNKEFPILK